MLLLLETMQHHAALLKMNEGLTVRWPLLKLMLMKLEKCDFSLGKLSLSIFSVNKSEKTDFLNHFYKHCMHGKFDQPSDQDRHRLSIQRSSQIIYAQIRSDYTENQISVFIAPLLSNTGAGSPEKTDSCTVQVTPPCCLLEHENTL